MTAFAVAITRESSAQFVNQGVPADRFPRCTVEFAWALSQFDLGVDVFEARLCQDPKFSVGTTELPFEVCEALPES